MTSLFCGKKKKKSLPGQMLLSQHFPWRSQSVLFVILYRAMENFIEINLPNCPKSALFAVQITVFLSLKCSLNSCVEKVLQA